MFGDKAREVLDFAAKTGTRAEFQSGEFIVSSGDAPASIIFFVSGDASLLTGHPQNGLIHIRKARPHEIFGLTETLAENSYSFSLLALSNCVVTMIPKLEFEGFLQLGQTRRARLIEFLADRIQHGEHSLQK